MDEPQQQPVTRQGTPPTPDNPYPSNDIFTEYPDGTVQIQIVPPTVQVLNEYEEATAKWPDDAGLRFHYSIELREARLLQEARKQIDEAIRLRPEWWQPHMHLALLLNDEGLHEASLSEYQMAVQFLLQEESSYRGHCEAILRRCMADQLHKLGRIAEAREELQQAIVIQQAAVNKYRDNEKFLQHNEKLLQHLKNALAEMGQE